MTARILLTNALLAAQMTGAGPAPAARLRLKEVLSAAVSAARVGEARLELARSNLRYLETLDKTRIELRPSIGVFAFSAPALLASNLGSSLVFNRRTAPGPAAMDNARFDSLAAEIAAANLKVRTEVEAARACFDLAGKQEVERIAAETLAARRRAGAEVDRFLDAGRITSAEKLAYQRELLDLEAFWLNADSERKASSTRLAVLIGRPELASTLSVEDVDQAQVAAAPEVERLVALALEHRPEIQLVKQSHAKLAFESGSAGYSYISNKSGVSNALAGGILGGHTGTGAISFTLPLRNTGEKPAHDAVTAARMKLLEIDLKSMEDSLRAEIATLRDAASSAGERARLAERKSELARQSERVIQARADTGLEALTAVWAANQAALSAQSAYLRARYEAQSSLYELAVVCGTERQ